MSATLKQEAIDNGLIDEATHDMLLADLGHWSRQAGIPEKFVFSALKDYCDTEAEIDYVSTIMDPDIEPIGMVYTGNIDGAAINERMMAIAGVCLRNYLNAKVMVLYDVLEALKQGEMPSPTVLLIPDFYDGSKVAEWQRNGLLGLLYKRQQEGKQTILYVSNTKALEAEYGKPFTDHMNGKFVPITN